MAHIRVRAFFAAAGLMACLLVSPLAGQKAKPAVAASAAPTGVRTGILVHGHWTIVVRNPDGSVAAKREFENALQIDGANALPIVMGGFAVPGGWGIMLGGLAAGDGPCQGGSAVTVLGTSSNQEQAMFDICEIVSSGVMYGLYPSAGCSTFVGGSIPANACDANLTTSVVNGPLVQYLNRAPVQEVGLGLSGVATITQQGQIATVGTFVQLCQQVGEDASLNPALNALNAPSTASPAGCMSAMVQTNVEGTLNLGVLQGFTVTGVPGGPISVVPKQSVQVTVVISFS